MLRRASSADGSASSRDPWQPGAWEDAGAGDPADGVDASPTSEDHGEQFAKALLRLKHTGVLSCRQMCELAWFATRAGATGPCRDLALAPSKQSGKYSSWVDQVLGAGNATEYYQVEMPLQDSVSGARVWDTLSTVPVQDALYRIVSAMEDVRAEVMRASDEDRLPGYYSRHHVTQAVGARRCASCARCRRGALHTH